jgi:hypothetical protein
MTGVVQIANIAGGAQTGIPDYRSAVNGLPGSCSIWW